MILVLVYFQCISATGYEDNSEHSHAYAHRNTAICLSAHAHESHYITCTQQKTVEIQVGQDSRCQFIWNNNYAHSLHTGMYEQGRFVYRFNAALSYAWPGSVTTKFLSDVFKKKANQQTHVLFWFEEGEQSASSERHVSTAD